MVRSHAWPPREQHILHPDNNRVSAMKNKRNLDPLKTTYATTQNELVDLDLHERLLYNDQ